MIDALGRLWMRLRLLVGRGRTTQVDDSKGAQVHQVRMGADELRDGTPRVAEYGFVSNPPADTDVIVVFIAGDRSNGVIIGTNNQVVRMRGLATGEVAIHDDKGRFMLLGATGIHVQGNSDPILAETTGPITARAGGGIDATSTGGNINLAAAAGTIALSAERITLAATVSLDLQAPAMTAEATTLGITAATAITGALTNNGDDIGNGHKHLPGTFEVGTSLVTGVSGVPTP